MRTCVIVFLLLLARGVLAGPAVPIPTAPNRLELDGTVCHALFVAMTHLQSRSDYSDEQRKVNNYKVWIRSSERSLRIDFIARPRSGDEGARGGNFDYAKSTTYIISTESFEIVRVVGSR